MDHLRKHGMAWIPDYPDFRDYTEVTEEIKLVLAHKGVLKTKSVPDDYILKGLAEDFWSILKKEWVDTRQFRE